MSNFMDEVLEKINNKEPTFNSLDDEVDYLFGLEDESLNWEMPGWLIFIYFYGAIIYWYYLDSTEAYTSLTGAEFVLRIFFWFISMWTPY